MTRKLSSVVLCFVAYSTSVAHVVYCVLLYCKVKHRPEPGSSSDGRLVITVVVVHTVEHTVEVVQ